MAAEDSELRKAGRVFIDKEPWRGLGQQICLTAARLALGLVRVEELQKLI